jgi:hypothetical protein
VTPEREKMIRDTWANIEGRVRAEVRDRGVTRAMARRCGIAKPWANLPDGDQEVELLTFTRVLREVTWSVDCEGLEVGTYRLDR